jgi:GrpB-like predicted nucleotidyltransferase (UPF0157 family)
VALGFWRYELRNIVVLPYDDIWAFEFEKIKMELETALKGAELSIEHVGSTSVKGLAAKPIIDIDIVIENDNFNIVRDRLREIGYEHVGDLGITGREAFKYTDKKHLMDHHPYVCAKDSSELKRHIKFRDHLRTNIIDRERYSAIKLEMASKYPHDIDNYINGKQPVILDIYKKCGLL